MPGIIARSTSSADFTAEVTELSGARMRRCDIFSDLTALGTSDRGAAAQPAFHGNISCCPPLLSSAVDIDPFPSASMKKSLPPASPDAYIDGLSDWQRVTVENLRASVLASADLVEVIKWGHLVYLSSGPVLLIRAEEQRVLFGFWRGKRLREIEARLKPSGKYEMATIELRETEEISPAIVRRLVKTAASFNETLGDPTKI